MTHFDISVTVKCHRDNNLVRKREKIGAKSNDILEITKNCLFTWFKNSRRSSFPRFFFFSIWVFFHDHSRIRGLQGKGEGIFLSPHYHFHSLHRHLDISQAIAAGGSPLHIASSRTRAWNLWFPSANR